MHCGSDQLKIVAVAFSAVQGVSLVLSVKALTFTSMAAVGELDISKLDISGGDFCGNCVLCGFKAMLSDSEFETKVGVCR
mgnify:FL=1